MRRLFRLWRLAGNDAKLLFSIARRSDRPRWLIPSLIVLAVFGLEPFNFAIPVLGAVDDLLIVPLVLRALAAVALHTSRDAYSRRSQDDRVVSVQ